MDKYKALFDYLKSEKRDDFYLSLSEIEGIIGGCLPKSAYIHHAYWVPYKTHTFANGIRDAGFKPSLDTGKKRARFVRLGQGESSSAASLTKPRERKSKRKTKDIPQPTPSLVKAYLLRWESLEDYASQEKAINRVYNDYRPNDDLGNVLIKCSVLNDFYSTNIFKIYPVAKRILDLDIDNRLEEGDQNLVNDIARNEVGSKRKNFYSFASKYCSHHKPLDYPNYDSYVHKVLMHFGRVDEFAEFAETDLKDYPKFKGILIKFREYYGLGEFNLKELDKFLWQFGKRYFPKHY